MSRAQAPSSRGNAGRRWTWVIVTAVASGSGILRARLLQTDFSLDEIWSYQEFVRRAHSIVDIFFNPAFRHDNNQHLNTVLMYLMGEHVWWPIYRIPAFTAGLAAIVVAAGIGWRRGASDAVFSAILIGASYLIAVTTTEARGYALLVLFAALAFRALDRYLLRPTTGAALAFWAWTTLGLASHVTILHFDVGALLWSGYRLRGRLAELVRLHTLPAVTFVLWALFVLRGTVIGGGPPWTWREMVDQSLAWTIGYPTDLIPAALAAAGACALVVADAVQLWRDGSDEGLFYVGAVLGPPILVTALAPPWLFPRYFSVSLFFFLLVVGRTLARVWAVPRLGRLMAAVIASVLVFGNSLYIDRFSTNGHGKASEAVRLMASSATETPSRVTSLSTDVWSSLPIQFYQRVLGFPGRLEYVPREAAQRGLVDGPIEWLIVQTQSPTRVAAATVSLQTGLRFRLRQQFPSYGPSGLRWFVYEREGAASSR